MIWKVSLVLSLALCVLSDKRPAISEQKIALFYGHHGDLSHVGHHEPEHHEVYAWAYPSYEFSYYVNDPHTHDHKGQHEIRDGDKVTGNYWLVQPDGRKRIVKYHSDHKKGFHAEVKYEDLHDGHHHEVRKHNEKYELEKHKDVWCRHCKEGRGEKSGGERRDEKRDHEEHHGHEDKHHWEHSHEQEEGRDEKRDDGRDEQHDDKRDGRRDEKRDGGQDKHRDNKRDERKDARRDGGHDKHHDDKSDERQDERRDGGHDERHKGGQGERHGSDNHRGYDKKRGHGDEEKEREEGEHKGGNRHEVYISEHRDDHENRGHEGSFWGIYGWGKEHDDQKDHHHEARKLENSKGHDYVEHWKHGRLVGWKEGKSREDSRGGKDRQGQGRKEDNGHKDRREQHSYYSPSPKFKPLVPYGHRLH